MSTAPKAREPSPNNRTAPPAVAPFDEVVRFHGHACPGLALGYRVAAAAMRELKAGRPEDEQLVAVVENDSCAVDAIQYVTGCTFGKGNLVHHDYGKHVYSFFNRDSGRAVRISEHFGSDQADREARIRHILDAPEQQFLIITPLDAPPPEPARIFNSVRRARPRCEAKGVGANGEACPLTVTDEFLEEAHGVILMGWRFAGKSRTGSRWAG